MSLPPALRARLDGELEARGRGHITDANPIGGGCISETTRLRTSSGTSLFLKWSSGDAPPGLFAGEAYSLECLAGARALRVPEVVALSDAPTPAPGDASWVLLEWLEPGVAAATTWERLGAGLAALHRARADAHYGWPHDNFIGTLHQANAVSANWPEFWRDCRLRPQLDLARAGGWFDESDAARFDALLVALDGILRPARTDGASLLHGDLWSGNLHVLASGEPSLIDPSSYYGHREVDLAMTQLFGGFDARFLHAYREAWPLEDGFDEQRCAVYQLYYLLVHLNLFGSAYRAPVLNALRGAGF